MSDAEKRRRKMLLDRMPGTSEYVFDALDEMLAEHRAALSRARSVALEEAAAVAHEEHRACGSLGSQMRTLDIENRIRALITTPAPAVIPVERVREVLKEYIPTERDRKEALRRLAVDLDARGADPFFVAPIRRVSREDAEAMFPAKEACHACGHAAHEERCVVAVSPKHSRGGAVAARACGCEVRRE